jgi:hypothetical protein
MQRYLQREVAARVIVLGTERREGRIFRSTAEVLCFVYPLVVYPVARIAAAEAALEVPHSLDAVAFAFVPVDLVVDRVLFMINPPLIAVRRAVP